MDYRRYNEAIYIRLDRGDEVVASILHICKQENIKSATFSGIGGCEDAAIQFFDPATREFQTVYTKGTLELVSLMGNVIYDEESSDILLHAHALFAHNRNGSCQAIGGHLKTSIVRYTAEIELRPITDGIIKKSFDPETGTGFWEF